MIADALGGHTAGMLVEGNRRYEIVVRPPEIDRESPEAIRRLPVRVGEHGVVSLGSVAEFRRGSTVSPILRDAGHRRSAWLVNLTGCDVESWVRDAEAKVRAQVKLPDGYRSNSAASSRI